MKLSFWCSKIIHGVKKYEKKKEYVGTMYIPTYFLQIKRSILFLCVIMLFHKAWNPSHAQFKPFFLFSPSSIPSFPSFFFSSLLNPYFVKLPKSLGKLPKEYGTLYIPLFLFLGSNMFGGATPSFPQRQGPIPSFPVCKQNIHLMKEE